MQAAWQRHQVVDRGGQVADLALIGRLYEHLGWQLALRPRSGAGTVADLDLATSLIPDEAAGS